MREGWKTVRLEDVCTFKPPKKEARQRLNPDDLVSFVPMNNLGVRSKQLGLGEERPLEKVAGSYTYFADGDVLLAKITPCFENGKLGIASGLTNGVGFGSSEFIVMRPFEELNAEYLFYFLSRDSFLDAGASVMSGAVGHKRVPKEFIEKLEFPLPNRDEQKRIVAMLDEAFEGIDSVVANTEKNLTNVRELFDGYLSSVFAQRGGGWVDQPLKDVCVDYGRGKSKHRPRNDPRLYGGNYPFIQTGDVRKSNHVIQDYAATYNEAGFAQSKLWPEGAICITIAANIAETGILGFDACFPDSIIGMVVDEKKASKEYVEYLLQSVKTVLKSKGKGSAQDNINLGTFENEKFPFPSLEKQKEIALNLHELSSTISSLEAIYQQKLNALAELKQSLLHKAFSGELTATEAEAAVEEATA